MQRHFIRVLQKLINEGERTNLFDDGLLGGGLGLDDGLDAVLGLVDDRLYVVLALDLEGRLARICFSMMGSWRMTFSASWTTGAAATGAAPATGRTFL
jgi:hypothetical protein